MPRRKKLPATVWIIFEDITGELWGASGWFYPPGELMMFEKEEAAQKEFQGISGRLFGATVKSFDLEGNNYVRRELL